MNNSQCPFVHGAGQIDFIGPVEFLSVLASSTLARFRTTIYANTITMHTRGHQPAQTLLDHLEKRLHHLKIINHQQRVRGHLVCACRRRRM